MSGESGEGPDKPVPVLKSVNGRFLRKPCSREEMLRVIREYLDEKPAVAEKAG
jgi:hypothetical protein